MEMPGINAIINAATAMTTKNGQLSFTKSSTFVPVIAHLVKMSVPSGGVNVIMLKHFLICIKSG